ncbi:hypothetical protein LUZ60_010693 [Juncus effusus]|nr:hypothetical protein LUZ60_010693 [Juncus effusus]
MVDYVCDAALSLQRLSMFRSVIYNTSMKSAMTPLKVGSSSYLMQLSIGTPALTFWAIADTGSDLIWTQCLPCIKCFSQPSPYFDPSKTSTYQKLACSSNLCGALREDQRANCVPITSGTFALNLNTGTGVLIVDSGTTLTFLEQYADDDYTSGYLATETIKIGNTAVPGITFGCGTKNSGDYGKSSGIVGLGGGKLSLISQLGLGKFSYCLQSDTRKINPILFGSLATLKGLKEQSTPLARNTDYSLYYVNLRGITVGTQYIPVQKSPIGLKNKKMLIDSGTTYAYLITPILAQVKRAFIDQVKLPVFGQQESVKLAFLRAGKLRQNLSFIGYDLSEAIDICN